MINHKYIKFLSHIVEDEKGSFHLGPALQKANLTEYEFNLIRDSFFYSENLPDNISVQHESLDWKLRPEAVFGYLTYKQYRQAVESSNRALWVSSASLLVAVVSLGVAVWATM